MMKNSDHPPAANILSMNHSAHVSVKKDAPALATTPKNMEALPSLHKTLERARKYAQTDFPVLISGETGSGKSELAYWMHHCSLRAGKSMRSIGVGDFNESTLVAELFGYVKGAYTGADRASPGLLRSCNGGSLILNDIDGLSSEGQTKLLHFLDSQEVTPVGSPERSYKSDVRIFSTTNADLSALIKKGNFRSDLYYRLAKAHLNVLPLRDRPDDIRVLARLYEANFLEQHPQDKQQRFTDKAIDLFCCMSWPGNMRELDNIICGCLVELQDVRGDISPRHVLSFFKEKQPDGLKPFHSWVGRDDARVYEVLRLCHFNVSYASVITGFTRQALYTKMKKYGWDG